MVFANLFVPVYLRVQFENQVCRSFAYYHTATRTVLVTKPGLALVYSILARNPLVRIVPVDIFSRRLSYTSKAEMITGRPLSDPRQVTKRISSSLPRPLQVRIQRRRLSEDIEEVELADEMKHGI